MIGLFSENVEVRLNDLATALEDAADRLRLAADGLRDFARSYDDQSDDPEAVHEVLLPYVDRTTDQVHLNLQTAARHADFMLRGPRPPRRDN